MNQQDNNLKFKKSIHNDYEVNPQIQRDIVKAKIMDEYNLSLDEAERIISKIEKNEFGEIYINLKNENSSQLKNTVHNKQLLKANSSSDVITPQHILDNGGDVKSYDNYKKTKIPNPDNSQLNIFDENKQDKIYEQKLKENPITKNINSDEMININQEKTNNLQFEILNVNDDFKDKNPKDVDSILGDIIPDYNQQVSIKVDHVDLTFEVSNEKIDTLKETFIRTLKRNKSKKIKIHALKDISFQIYKGEKVGIIGYNGAGKSTLLNVITGIYHPDTGYVNTYGKISPLLSLGAGFDHNFSGRKNIILNGAVLGYDKKFLESKMDEIIEFSELGEFIDIPIKNYSSGMLAKLGFSIATALNPDILIIDEILGVGDVNFRKKSGDKLKSLMDGGTTVLLVSHSIPQIRELCDKAIWIDNGKLRGIGEVNKICDNYLKDAEKASNEQLANIQFR